MAILKRGFCTYCDGDETLRIFEVNKDAEVCYCPHCAHPMQPKDAIMDYRNLLSHYLKKASRYLFETTEYLRSYQTFAHVIDLDDSVKVAYFGRILSLVHLSTLRKSKIPFAMQMHKQQAGRLFHYQETKNEYFHFLLLLLDALDSYENRIKKRLSSHSVFYDVDCVVLYLKRVEENRQYKEFIASEAQFFIESNKDQFKVVVDRVEKEKEHYQNVLKEVYVTTDGNNYLFNEYGPNITPILTMKSDHQELRVHHIKESISLYPKDNKKSPIHDDIYPNNLPIFIFVSASIPLAVAFFLSSIAAVIVALAIPEEVEVAKIFIFIGAVILTSVSLMLLILHFSWKNRLKKKYYNGTNPFILK